MGDHRLIHAEASVGALDGQEDAMTSYVTSTEGTKIDYDHLGG